MERCRCVSPITGRLMTWLWRGEILHKSAAEGSKGWAHTLTVFNQYTRVFTETGWMMQAKQTSAEVLCDGKKESAFTMTTYSGEKAAFLSSSTGYFLTASGPDKLHALIEAIHCLTWPIAFSYKLHFNTAQGQKPTASWQPTYRCRPTLAWKVRRNKWAGFDRPQC